MRRLLATFLREVIILYWVLLVLACIAAIAMSIPEIALYLQLLQLAGGAHLGMLTPFAVVSFLFSFLLTNLWWVLLLALPFILLLRSRPGVGFVISAMGFAALLLVPPQIIKGQSARMLTDATVTVAPQPAGSVTSATIFADGCDDLCQRLLLGGSVTTVRVAELRQKGGTNAPLPQLMFQRANPDLCRAYDPQFPTNAPCILPFLDDGKPSDVVLDTVTDGSFSVKRDQLGFKPHITFRRVITLRKLVSGTTLAADSHIRWLEPHGWVPLYANTGFDGNGIHGGGLVPAQKKGEKGAGLQPATLFEQSGIPLGGQRGEVVVNKRKMSAVLRGYPEPAVYDIALLRALLTIDGLHSDTAQEFLSRWTSRFVRHNLEPDAQEVELINLLFDNLRPLPNELSLLVLGHPEYLSGGIERLYERLDTSEVALFNTVSEAITRFTMARSPEENAPHEDLFLEALAEAEKRDHYLIGISGRFTFNPVPVLQSYLDTSDQTSINPVNRVLLAACQADGRWATSLAPLVSEIALSLPGNRNKRDADREVGRALDALNTLGQREAWEALKSALGSERTKALKFADWGNVRDCR